MYIHEAPLPPGCDLFAGLSMLIKHVLSCDDSALSGILHKRCVTDQSGVSSDAMLVLDASSDVLDPQEVEEFKETKEKHSAATKSADEFHDKWRTCFVFLCVLIHLFMYLLVYVLFDYCCIHVLLHINNQ